MNKKQQSLLLLGTLLLGSCPTVFALTTEQLPPSLNDTSATTATTTSAVTSTSTTTPATTATTPAAVTTAVTTPATTTTTTTTTTSTPAATTTKTTPAFQDFKDVPVTHPNYNAIIVLRYQGVLSGYSDNTFHPDQELNRVEALKLIFEVANVNLSSGIAEAKFKDTIASSWYAGYLNKAVFLEVVGGYSDGTFRPEKPVNLVEFLKMLELAQKVDLSKTNLSQIAYTDVAPGQWYTKYINFAKINSLVDADKDGKVYPEKSITRGQAADIIYRFRNIKKTPASTTTPTTTTSTSTATSTVFSPEKDFALYVSSSYKFAIQYPKKWFYSVIDNTDKTAIRTYGFGPKDLSTNPAVVTLELLPDSKDFTTNLVYKEVSYYKETTTDNQVKLSVKIEGSSRIYRLTGASDQETTMLNMLATMTSNITGLESVNPEEKKVTDTTTPATTTTTTTSTTSTPTTTTTTTP